MRQPNEKPLAALCERAAADVVSGALPSCQLAMAQHGQMVLELTIGAPADSRYAAFSCTKAITAGAVWLLIESGQLGVDTPVADLVDGFGANGKQGVTLEHLLTHTAGFPQEDIDPAEWTDPDARTAAFAGWPARWPPGSRFEYHGRSASLVLAHLVEATTGRDFREFVRTEVLDAIGLAHTTLGTLAPPDTPEFTRDLDAAALTVVGREPDPATARSLGLDISAIGTDVRSLLDEAAPAVRALGHPAGGAISTAGDLALLYQALLGNIAGPWSPGTLAAGTAEIRCTMRDPMTSVPANRTLGLVMAGDDGNAMMRGFGRSVSPAAFGHMGAGGQIAWADPASGLSFAYLTNGLERDPVILGMRSDALCTAAGRCGVPAPEQPQGVSG